MLGGMISDLETGDEFQPIRYTVTSLMTAEYAHGVEETDEWFLSDANPLGRQVRIPLMIHADKMRLLEVNCPAGQGSAAFAAPTPAYTTNTTHAIAALPMSGRNWSFLGGFSSATRGGDGSTCTTRWRFTLATAGS